MSSNGILLSLQQQAILALLSSRGQDFSLWTWNRHLSSLEVKSVTDLKDDLSIQKSILPMYGIVRDQQISHS